MVTEKTVAIVGGDLRHAHLANTFIEKHDEYKVYVMFLDNDVKLSSKLHKSNDIRLVLPVCDIVIFPLPFLCASGLVNTPQSDDKLTLEECLDYVAPGAILLAGMIPQEVNDIAKSRGIDVIDYFLREEFAVLNAVPVELAILLLK